MAGPSWDLTTEYESTDDVRIKEDLEALTRLLDEAETLNEAVDRRDVAAAQAVAKVREAAVELIANVSTYSSCLLSVDSQDEGAQRLGGQLLAFRKRMGDVFEPLSQFIDQEIGRASCRERV